ncbi:MFS transporter [uncultured Shimia sp.]|uniref:MFS transporter n=1 Tax=uncultured Shimia sp. TaxID=573152 RepID=UPI00262495D1|nr:MFS transporter [uncultured Shimia sp.]
MISTGAFLRQNGRYLLPGAMLMFLSCFGQTFFIGTFAADIRASFELSHSLWGAIYMLGTGTSALLMLWAGTLADHVRVRILGPIMLICLAGACVALAFLSWVWALPFVILALRFTAQGMLPHISAVAMARWFAVSRGRALAFATMGFMLAEAIMPITVVWLKGSLDWHLIWMLAAGVCLLMAPVIYVLLRQEREPQHTANSTTSLGMEGRSWTRWEAIRHPVFLSAIPAMMAFPAFATVFFFQQTYFAEIKGWSHLSLVSVFPLGTLAFGLSTLTFGWLIDRFGASRLMPLYLLPLVAAFAVHAWAPSVGWVALGVVLMGLAGGGQATLPASVWSEFFGTKHLGAIKATVAAFAVLGSALGPGLSGWLIDRGVPYEQQLFAFAVCFACASAIMVLPFARARQSLAP